MTGFANWLQGVRPDPGDGVPVDHILGRSGHASRSWWDADGAPDPDAEAAQAQDKAEDKEMRLLVQRYSPGSTLQLSQRLGETLAELEDERAKAAKAEKQQQRLHRMYEKGQISAWDFGQQMDACSHDASRADKLERRADSLSRQLAAEGSKVGTAHIAGGPLDPLEEAGRQARAAYLDAVRTELNAAPTTGPRPFDGPGDDGEPDCAECAEVGATRSESARIHAEMGEIERGVANPYQSEGYYDAGEIVRGTESAIVGVVR